MQAAFGGPWSAVHLTLIQPRNFDMKIIPTLAAALATLTSSSAAFAHEPTSGHFEWRAGASVGPRAISHRVRVWVTDDQAQMANHCAIMHDTAKADDSMAGLRKARAPSNS